MEQSSLRTLRDAERIERIRTGAEARVRLTLYTPGLARVVRKDFNIVSAKMFLARADKAAALSTALRECERSCVQAELAAERHRADYGVALAPQSFELRIVSPFANRYYRSILRLDAVNKLLVAAETRGVIDRRARAKIVRPCLGLIFEVKRIALDLPKRETSRPSSAPPNLTATANP